MDNVKRLMQEHDKIMATALKKVIVTYHEGDVPDSTRLRVATDGNITLHDIHVLVIELIMQLAKNEEKSFEEIHADVFIQYMMNYKKD